MQKYILHGENSLCVETNKNIQKMEDKHMYAKTKWFSNNPLRFFTGTFFGIALISFLLHIHFLLWELVKKIVSILFM